ncbi:homeobox and leucine zipper protein Homez [Xenopus laevis]|uniref:Homeobox and Leucine zipper protein Homez n=2 Tax=Xenopus laevis TaxID=8355 RepID=A0A1L8HYS0_XENLA|nr:homeobox and leucine zipper protein Homez [Xenopus laevis]XP_018100040.1 homeobox and leucine zipper protein Homez [Xenopus laevis]XP_018100049.1 homeobox and leucine zipper protein Homez [Xenopus laevis]OCU01237.1 hypothetical protein XELAEV_18007027mg [Xenopus laevis]
MTPTTNRDPVSSTDSNIGLVCLPPISDDLQLIWTRAELTNELDDHQQLLHTFSYFPYPSIPEIALLCMRNGLQMEKVKSWFMVQRIRCGISWSSEEIEETRSRLLFNQDKLYFEPLLTLAKESGISPTPEKLKVQSPKSSKRQNMTTPQTSPCFDHAVPEAKRLKTEGVASETESIKVNTHMMHSSDKKWDPSETQQEHGHSSSVLGHGLLIGEDGTEVSPAVECIPSEEELLKETTSFCYPEGLSTLQDYYGLREQSRGSSTPGMRRQRKTKEQLAILKSFFVKCQWAGREDYKKLEEITGLPRTEIIQWFGDTRYGLKHGQLKWFRESAQEQPTWLEPQHLISQNGNEVESMPGEMSSLTPAFGELGADNRSTVQSIKNSGANLRASPVTLIAATSSKTSLKFLANSPEIKDGKQEVSLGSVLQDDSGADVQFANTSGSEQQLAPSALQTMKKNSSASPAQTSSQRVKYFLLETSKEQAEVDDEEERCVVEVIEGEDDDDYDDDDVISQD